MTRRMFSDEITTTDTFLDMPKGSQLLYFHLGMHADDDGFIANPKMVMRAIGSSDDELKILFVKKFLLSFESGVCVVKHWRINNYIRKQIYQETKYVREKELLYIRPNGAYSLNSDGALPVPLGHFTTDSVRKKLLSTSRRRTVDLGKVRLGKISKDNTNTSSKDDRGIRIKNSNKKTTDTLGGYSELFQMVWSAYPRKDGKGAAFKEWEKIKPKPEQEFVDMCICKIESLKKTEQWQKDDGQFIPHLRTWLSQKRYDDEITETLPSNKVIKIN